MSSWSTLGLLEPVVQTADSTMPYSMGENTFGRLYLPSVYGKDLSAFEIASSGKIVLSLNDRHAVNISEADAMVYVQPAASNSVQVSLPNDIAHMTLNADGQYVDVAAVGTVFVQGGDSVQISTGGELAMLSMYSSNVYITSGGTLAMATANQQAYVSIDTEMNNVNIFSSNDCTIYSQHDVIVKAKAMHIFVEEFNLTYSFVPTSTGALGLHQTVTDPVTGLTSSVQVAKFGQSMVL